MTQTHRPTSILLAGFVFFASLSFAVAQDPDPISEEAYGNVRVAIIDSGFNPNSNPGKQIAPLIQKRKSFVPSRTNEHLSTELHGTEVAYHITSHGRRNLKLYMLDVMSSPSQETSQAALIDALDWIVRFNENQSGTINAAYFPLTMPALNQSKDLLRKSVNRVFQSGTTLIVPAGDQDRPIKTRNTSMVPAAYENTLTTGGIRVLDGETNVKVEYAPDSNYGAPVDVVTFFERYPANDSITPDRTSSWNAATATRVTSNLIAESFDQIGPEFRPSSARIQQMVRTQAHTPRTWPGDPSRTAVGLINQNTTFHALPEEGPSPSNDTNNTGTTLPSLTSSPASVGSAAKERVFPEVNGVPVTETFRTTWDRIQSADSFPSALEPLNQYHVLFVRGFLSSGIIDVDTSEQELQARIGPQYKQQKNWMEANGISHQIADIGPANSIQENGELIRKQIMNAPKPVLLVTHSKGSIDSLEALIDHPDVRRKTAGWVSIQGSFLGSPVADWVLNNSVLSDLAFHLLEEIGGTRESLKQLGTERRNEYTRKHREGIETVRRDVPMISFTSYKSEDSQGFLDPDELDTILEPFRDAIVKHRGLKNDGLMPWKFSILPGSRYIKIKGVDHFTSVSDSNIVEFNHVLLFKTLLAMIVEQQSQQ